MVRRLVGVRLQDETCIKQRVPCEYCELPVPLVGFEEHEKFCASKTEECPTCGNRIMIRYFHDHLLECNAGTQPFPNLRDLHRYDRSKYDDDDLLTDGSAVLPIQPDELLQRGHRKERLLDDGAGVYDRRFGDLYEGDDWNETNGEEGMSMIQILYMSMIRISYLSMIRISYIIIIMHNNNTILACPINIKSQSTG